MKAAERKWIFRESQCFQGLQERRDKIDRATAALRKMQPTAKKYPDKEKALANHKRHLANQIEVCRLSCPNRCARLAAPAPPASSPLCLAVHLWSTLPRAGLRELDGQFRLPQRRWRGLG